MALQDSMLKPSVFKSPSVNNRCLSVHLTSKPMLGQTRSPDREQEDGSLTLGHHPVEDGPELCNGDLHVLSGNIVTCSVGHMIIHATS